MTKGDVLAALHAGLGNNMDLPCPGFEPGSKVRRGFDTNELHGPWIQPERAGET